MQERRASSREQAGRHLASGSDSGKRMSDYSRSLQFTLSTETQTEGREKLASS